MVLKDGSAQTDGNWTDMAAEKLRMEKKRKRRAASAKEGREGRHTVETVETVETVAAKSRCCGTAKKLEHREVHMNIYILYIYLSIWVNYNDLTDLPHWNHG